MQPVNSPDATTVLDLGDSFYPSGPTQPSSSFEFHTMAPTSPGEFTVSGSIEPQFGGGGGDGGFGSRKRRFDGGLASKFLDNRGFGWLLEVDEDGDEENKPLLEELDIDLKDVAYKVRCVLLPLPYFRLKLELVRENTDFWGPLLIVLTYALLSLYGQMHVVSWILTIWFCGSFLIFFLARVLGGDVGYSQCLGVVGYCLIPLVVVGAILPILKGFHYIELILKLIGVMWAVYSAGTLLCVEEIAHKKSLLLYPIFLLYIYFFSMYTGV